MGLKKYEIITVGSDKRVRALRSWRVQDRYVNIGDVGGIVYDEKTLSQDGACWLFRGNFGFPGARIGGDSIVDVGEAILNAEGAPNVDILGASVVVGAPVRFASDQTTPDAFTLSAAYFERGSISYSAGANWETWKTTSSNHLRTKAPIFMGGVSATLKLDVPGYTVQAYVLDRDGIGISATASTDTGAGVTLAVPAGQYMVIRLANNPVASIVPDDATAAQIIMTAVFETKLVVVDSRVEVNPANATGMATIKPGGTYVPAPGVKYPEAVIRNSKVSINVPAATSRTCRLMAQIIGSTAALDAIGGDVSVVGQYSNVKNITVSGVRSTDLGLSAYNIIQATDCDNFKNTPMVISYADLVAAQTANMPFIFQGCNVPDGRFYHHAQIANTYKNIDFDLATADLGKSIGGDAGKILVSSEVNGMYRGYRISPGIFGPLIESAASVVQSALTIGGDSYATTIYADAYLNGAFDFKGTNVFGNSMKHEASNTQNVMVVQGGFTLTAGSPPVPSTDNTRLRTVEPVRINGSKGLSVQSIPAGVEGRIVYLDAAGNYKALGGWYTGDNVVVPASQLVNSYAYLMFRKLKDAAITPDDVKGVTVTTYNGCRLVNAKATATAATIAGNVRVEDNATIIDTSVTGTGYFGGNSIIQAPSALVGQLPIKGAAYMSDNAVFAPSEVNASAGISLLEMSDNATFSGQLAGASTNYNITMANNAQFLGTHGSSNGFIMRDNSFIAAGGTVVSACMGLLAMKDDARIEAGTVTTVGDITLCGKYKQTVDKTWTGKRVISSQDAPTYDDNVKTQYDF